MATNTSAVLEKYSLTSTETFEAINPVTKEKKTVTLRRDGMPESEFLAVMENPKKTREEKDFALSMFLWGRGAESASMMVDLMRYKGAHTKETRVFKSQIRFDFEQLVELLAENLRARAFRIGRSLDIDVQKEYLLFLRWIALPNNKGKGHTYKDFSKKEPVISALIEDAIYSLDEADRLMKAREGIRKAREAEKGGGIYVSTRGQVYSVNDKDVGAIIESDRAATRAIEHE